MFTPGSMGPPPERQLKKFKKQLPLLIRSAMERTFYIWLRIYGPRRFGTKAFSRYKTLNRDYKVEYKGFSLKYKKMYLRLLSIAIRRGQDTKNPLEKSGQLKSQFINGSIKFSGGRRSGRLTATWMSLPSNPFKGQRNVDVAAALTDLPDDEINFIQTTFDRIFNKELNDAQARFTWGRMTLTI